MAASADRWSRVAADERQRRVGLEHLADVSETLLERTAAIARGRLQAAAATVRLRPRLAFDAAGATPACTRKAPV